MDPTADEIWKRRVRFTKTDSHWQLSCARCEWQPTYPLPVNVWLWMRDVHLHGCNAEFYKDPADMEWVLRMYKEHG